jgi:hypothetical protein
MMGVLKTRALLFPALLGLAGSVHASTVNQGGEAPNVAGTWLNRETTTLKDLRGMAVLLDFWGTH